MFPIRAHSLSANQYLYFDGDDLPIHQKVSCFFMGGKVHLYSPPSSQKSGDSKVPDY